MSVSFEKKNSNLSYSFNNTLTTQAHLHKEIEMVYIIDGESYAYIDKKEYLLKTGDVFIVFPYQIHSYTTLEKGEFLIMIFSPETLFSMEKLFLTNRPETNLIHNEHIIDLIKRLLAADKSFFHDNIVLGYLNIIIPNIIKPFKLFPFTDVNSSSISTLVDYCSEHYTEDLSLEIVSEKIHLSKYHISKLMNNTLNISFTEYINNLRIIKACDLLKNTDKKIAYISNEVGFGTIRSFNRLWAIRRQITESTFKNYKDTFRYSAYSAF